MRFPRRVVQHPRWDWSSPLRQQRPSLSFLSVTISAENNPGKTVMRHKPSPAQSNRDGHNSTASFSLILRRSHPHIPPHVRPDGGDADDNDNSDCGTYNFPDHCITSYKICYTGHRLDSARIAEQLFLSCLQHLQLKTGRFPIDPSAPPSHLQNPSARNPRPRIGKGLKFCLSRATPL